jgi:DNA-binding NarL/FixJ family response regulator
LYEEATYVEAMVAAGASGYVLKTGQPEKLMKAIRTVAAGGTYFDQVVSSDFSAGKQEQTGIKKLSTDEFTVVKRVAEGHTNAEIAAHLEITIPAVEKHRTSAMKKLNVRSRAELARIAALSQW